MIGLHNRIQPYAWGSRTAIATLQRRRSPSPGPEAELWLGAHPSASSTAVYDNREQPLTDIIAADPEGMLGRDVVSRFGARLPYLFKALAAAEPLSLQVHPDADQAAAGFAREESGWTGARNYVDPYHKPELLVALEEFHALCGFRPPELTAALLASFGVPALAPLVDALGQGPAADRLRIAVELVLGQPAGKQATLADEVAAAGAALSGEEGPHAESHALAADLGKRYPGDSGMVLALLLNQVRLKPGEAVFMPAGNLHAYLRGVAVELMAASDNVLRGGLTPKHVDAAELMRVLRYEVLADPVIRPVELEDGLVTWESPADEFALSRARPEPGETVTMPGSGPRIAFCVNGMARLRCGGQRRNLRRGESVFLAANEPALQVSGDADVFQAGPPLLPA